MTVVDVQVRATAGARTSTLWRPELGTNLAVALGGAPSIWQSHPAQPTTLNAAGWNVATVDTPNWGNTTDLAIVDDLLASLPAGLVTDRLILLGHGRHAAAALNWAARHVDRVAALALVSPVIDLEEHWTRVTADQASMNAAYGGSAGSFAAAMPANNPNNDQDRCWGRRVLEQLGDRMTMWWAPGDTVTPPAVHQALATYFRCRTGVLASADPLTAPAAVVDQAVADAEGWDQQSAAVMWQLWATYRRNNSNDQDWAGGDANNTVGPLPDGRRLWTFADTLIGPVGADESRTSGFLLAKNSIVVENADGTLGATLHHTGSTGPSIVPADAGAGAWYWPNNGVVEGSSVRLIVNHVVPPLTIDGIHIVTLDATTLAQTGAAAKPYVENHWWGYSPGIPLADGYTYTSGEIPGGFLSRRTALARWPTGNILGQWQYWAGDGWSTDDNDTAALLDADGDPIRAAGTVTRMSDGRWILAGQEHVFSTSFGVWVTRWPPTGHPHGWTLYRTFDMEPAASEEPYGAAMFTYGVPQHPHRAQPGELVFSYAVNSQAPTGLVDDSALYQPRYVVMPVPPRDFPPFN